MGSNFIHLTNYSVNKLNEEGKEEVIEGNMWSCEELQKALVDRYGEDMFLSRIQPAMHTQVKESVSSLEGQIDLRERSFEVLGFDFMVDDQLQTHFVEINASPSMEHSSHVTARFVDIALRDIVRLAWDYKNGGR